MAAPALGEVLLSELLAGIQAVAPGEDRWVHGLSADSRALGPGALFLAFAGAHAHGLSFAADAVAAGASALLYDPQGHPPLDQALARVGTGFPLIAVPSLRRHAGLIADRFFKHPSSRLRVIGITGTNGKTSTAHFLAQSLSANGPCGVIGTLGSGLSGQLATGLHTTPDVVRVHEMLARFADHGARHAVMEVSSHGLDQERVAGVRFDTAVFTNLSRDHLDYHGSMEKYGAAKRSLFEMPGLVRAVIHIGDPFGEELLRSIRGGSEVIAYRIDHGDAPAAAASALALVLGSKLRSTAAGLEMDVQTTWGRGRLRSEVLGRYNAANLLAVLATLLGLGVPFEEAVVRIGRTHPVPGRMEKIQAADNGPLVVVDYAHTPDALAQVLRSLRELCHGRLLCVFGCGGERDRGKRPLMGAVAEELSDQVYLTDDNPRGEPGQQIVDDILRGVRDRDRVRVERDRAAAIALAVHSARAADIILVAGKGHESYQILGESRLPFDDREIARRVLLGG